MNEQSTFKIKLNLLNAPNLVSLASSSIATYITDLLAKITIRVHTFLTMSTIYYTKLDYLVKFTRKYFRFSLRGCIYVIFSADIPIRG